MFHNWEVKGKILECTICNQKITLQKYNEKDTKLIREKYRKIRLREITKKYCKSGDLHQFVHDLDLKCDICIKCKHIDSDKLTDAQLSEIYKNIVMAKQIDNKKKLSLKNKQIQKEQIKRKKDTEIINNIKMEYKKSKLHKEHYFNYIKKFINNIQSVIGTNMYLNYDTYIVDHDHNGYNLDSSIVIVNKNKKIVYKKKHPFFKTDVIYYTNHKLNLNVFYDAITLLLLGYKEFNKKVQYSKIKNKHIKINYSITNKIKMLGYTSKYINISDRVNELKINTKDKQHIIKTVVTEINRYRIANLKKTVTEIQKYIYRILYNYELPQDDAKFDTDSHIIDKYKNKLTKMKISDGKYTVFDDWNVVKYKLYFQSLDKKTVNLNADAKYLIFNNFSDYDYHGNLILYYIIRELSKLINYNYKKFIKVSVAHLIIDIINKIHIVFNEEYKEVNYEIKRFNYIIQSDSTAYDTESQGYGIDGTFNELSGEYRPSDYEITEEELVQRENDIEALDALDLDIDRDLDYEIDYMPGINVN